MSNKKEYLLTFIIKISYAINYLFIGFNTLSNYICIVLTVYHVSHMYFNMEVNKDIYIFLQFGWHSPSPGM